TQAEPSSEPADAAQELAPVALRYGSCLLAERLPTNGQTENRRFLKTAGTHALPPAVEALSIWPATGRLLACALGACGHRSSCRVPGCQRGKRLVQSDRHAVCAGCAPLCGATKR